MVIEGGLKIAFQSERFWWQFITRGWEKSSILPSVLDKMFWPLVLILLLMWVCFGCQFLKTQSWGSVCTSGGLVELWYDTSAIILALDYYYCYYKYTCKHPQHSSSPLAIHGKFLYICIMLMWPVPLDRCFLCVSVIYCPSCHSVDASIIYHYVSRAYPYTICQGCHGNGDQVPSWCKGSDNAFSIVL